jgi:KDO2-lipid IV(A) lauroyltransferase
MKWSKITILNFTYKKMGDLQLATDTKPMFSIKNLFFQNFLVKLGVFAGKIIPRKIGLALANAIGTILGSRKNNPRVQAIRANQWVVHQQSLSKNELDPLPKVIFRSSARCMFDYFYFLNRPEKLDQIIDYSPEAMNAVKRIQQNKPCVVVCPHTSNFDLLGYALSLMNIGLQVLSFPNPTDSYKMQNKLRENLDVIVTPMSLSAFRQARQRLKEGGSILTGFDRPLSGNIRDKYQPKFFGFESNLPVTYARMAKEADAPVFIMAATSSPGNRYFLEGSPPIWMESADDLQSEILNNVERVLKEGEIIIKEYADQWAMFYPVWPQFLGV